MSPLDGLTLQARLCKESLVVPEAVGKQRSVQILGDQKQKLWLGDKKHAGFVVPKSIYLQMVRRDSCSYFFCQKNKILEVHRSSTPGRARKS